MTHDHAQAGARGESIDWDARYSESEQVWSGNPNGALVAEVADLTPGTALDVGCGEGADAIWLAKKGWKTTAFDVSAVALSRAAEHAARSGATVELLLGGLLDVNLNAGTFDLVNVQYPALLLEAGRSVRAILDLVSPGGTLLFVHHVFTDTDHPRDDFDPADYVFPTDVRAALDDRWELQVFEERARHVETGAGAGHVADLVLRVRRLHS